MRNNMLCSYEDNRHNISFDIKRDSSDKDYKTIFLDEMRVDPSSGYAAVPFFYFYRFVTREILLDTNLPYYQGFFDIAFYIVYYYFRSTLRERCNDVASSMLASNSVPASDDSLVALCIDEESIEDSFVNVFIGEQKSYIVEKILSENYYASESTSYTTDENFEKTARLCMDRSTYLKCRTVVWNVIYERVLKVYHESPSTYLTYKKRLIEMLKGKGVDVDSFENIYFIESSFFTLMSRDIEGADNILAMYDAILSFPDYGVFLLIYHYNDTIGRKDKIQTIEPDLKKRIEKVERMFNGTESIIATRHRKQDVCMNTMLVYIPAGAVLGVAAFVVFVVIRTIFRIRATAH